MDRADAERADPNALYPVRIERVLDRGRFPLAEPAGPDEQQARLGQPAECKPERGRRRRVEPLEVVDRDDQLLLGEQLQGAADRDPEGPRIDRTAGWIRDEQGNLERAPLRRRQLRENVVEDPVEEVAQPGEGERALRLGRT